MYLDGRVTDRRRSGDGEQVGSAPERKASRVARMWGSTPECKAASFAKSGEATFTHALKVTVISRFTPPAEAAGKGEEATRVASVPQEHRTAQLRAVMGRGIVLGSGRSWGSTTVIIGGNESRQRRC